MPERVLKLRAVLACAAALCTGAGAGAAQAQDAGVGQDFAAVDRGRYLAVLADCAACHTDRSNQPFAGGRPIQTPFGVVAAPNITPDRDTGIGAWSDAEFDAALRDGKMPGGARLYPAMPFTYFSRMSARDVADIRTYLKTVEPVRNAVVSNQLPFPFNIRASMLVWDELYFKPMALEPDDSQSPQWNRGRYLVEGPGHCGACHTPKTFLGGDEAGEALQGYSIQGWFAPNITNDVQRGLGGWTVTDVVDYLKKGHNRLAAASGPMAEEITNSSSRLQGWDLEAIAAYLKSRPGRQDKLSPLRQDDPRMAAGAAIYGDLCSACHAPDGTGVPFLIPNLALSASVASREPTSLLEVVLRGARSVATAEEPTAPAMPAYAWQLTDVQIAAVATYVRNSWGHAAAAATEAQVRKARASPAVASD